MIKKSLGIYHNNHFINHLPISYQPKVKKSILNIKIEKYYAQFVQSKYHHIEILQYIQILDMYSALQGVCVWIATEILDITFCIYVAYDISLTLHTNCLHDKLNSSYKHERWQTVNMNKDNDPIISLWNNYLLKSVIF